MLLLTPTAAAPVLNAMALAQDADALSQRALGWADLVPHRDFLVRFAQRRALDPNLAEDLVHDVFEAVVTGRAQFGGRSALRSWLAAILKHKIADLGRAYRGHDSLDDDGDGDDDFSALSHLECPQPRPDEWAEQRQQLHLVLQRLGELPIGLRQALELRVLHDRSTQEVCDTLAISEDNLFVRLHRARKRLLA